MSNKTAFQVGDIVKLKSGGPDMTVQYERKDSLKMPTSSYLCQWFAGKKLDEGIFRFESLVKVEDKV